MSLKEKYPNLWHLCDNLFKAYGSFTDGMRLDSSIFNSKELGLWDEVAIIYVDKIAQIRQELDIVRRDESFDWIAFAVDTGMLDLTRYTPSNHEVLTSSYVFDYFKLVAWSAIYPEYRFSQLKFEELRRTIFYLLRDIALFSDEWVDIDFVLEFLKQKDVKWTNLQRFHIQYIKLMASPFSSAYSAINTLTDTKFGLPSLNYVPIVGLRIYPAVTRVILELLPNSLIDEDYDLMARNGYGLENFVWTKEDSLSVHLNYQKYKNRKNKRI
jgi:hypothetical protein